MKTIVINSQKGGSGKTMLAKHLAVQAESAGDGPVFLIDTDPQGSLTVWHKKREAESPVRIEVPFDKLAGGIDVLRKKGGAICIIDSASGRLDVAQTLFALADLVLFPVQPSEDDLSAAPVTVANLKAAGTPFLFVLTRVKPNTLITAQAAAILSKHGRVAETLIADRTGYKSPYGKGQLVIEADPRNAAAREIEALWQNVKSCIHENMKG
jgi:chromosome partitioning protein